MTAATITKEWAGETVAIFASGPSMAAEHAEMCRGVCRVIAINNQSFDCAPWADVIWASDFKWWQKYADLALPLPGRKFHVLQGQSYPGVETLLQSHQTFDDRPGYISCGGNSGYAALCLAVKYGAKRVLLYGYDMRNVNGRDRRFDYPGVMNSKPRFAHWIRNFERLAPELAKRDVEVINCTMGSNLRCFPFSARAEARHVA